MGVDLWAGDEFHFQQFGSRCRMWIAPEVVDTWFGTIPHARVLVTSEPLTARWQAGLPAATPETKIQRRNLLRISQTSQTMCQPFGAASRRDCGQRYLSSCTTSQSWRDLHAAHFQLYFLPPYSPELNPIERVWKLTRRKCLHNQHFSTLDQVVETVEQQFQLWGKANSTLTTYAQLLKSCVSSTTEP